MSNEVFCYAPWMSLQNDPRGFFNVCCVYADYEGIGSVEDGWKAAWNSEKLKKIREGFKKGDIRFTDNCKSCVAYEKLGGSQRQSCREYHEKAGSLSFSQSIKRGPVFLDLRFSTLCNQSCIMCGPHASSRWSANLKLSAPKLSCESLVDLVRDNLKTIQVIRFAGGEPLIAQEHYDILKLLKEAGRTDVRLVYNTNLSTVTFKDYNVFDFWKEFPDKEITVSVDAVGDKNDYIRFGSKWNVFENNCKSLLEICSKNQVYFHPTIQVLNVAEMPHLCEFVNSIGGDDCKVIWGNILNMPQELDVRRLSTEIQEQIYAMIDESQLKDPVKAWWQNLLKVLRQSNLEKIDSQKTVNYLNWIDSIHKTDWKVVFPQIAKIL